MSLLDIYRSQLRRLISDQWAQGRSVVFKGYQAEIFREFETPLYLSPVLPDGSIDLALIETHKRAIYKELIDPSTPILLLFEQLSFAIENSSFEPIRNNLVIIEDNLRALYPYAVSASLVTDGEVDGEPITAPALISYAQALSLPEGQFIKYITSPEQVQIVQLFPDVTDPERIAHKEHPRFVDLEADSTSIDLLIIEFIKEGAVPEICVELSPLDPLFATLGPRLAVLNACFKRAGGHLCLYSGEVLKPAPQTSARLQRLLERYWGPGAHFRPITCYTQPEVSKSTQNIGQDMIVDQIIAQCDNASNKKEYRDIFITAPTGAGKSLLFQLPAFHLSERNQVTLVISPLIALMKDQVQAIVRDRNYRKVAYLNSELSLVDREKVIEHVKLGDIDVVYLSPELLLSYDISHFIGERKLGLVIIDEAHLVTTWGRDFRVDYWFLGNHLRKTRKYSGHDFVIMACTATAVFGGANDMVFDCMDSLYLKSPVYFIGSVTRRDIHFVIGREESPEKGYDSFKLKQTIQFCKSILERTKLKTLVYAPYVKQITHIQEPLEPAEKAQTSMYYGSLDQISKAHFFDEYLIGKRRLMLATKAFGMGIDIKDIEVVYHHAPSGQLADYVQEIGRLARDPALEGYAAINFSARDVRYTNVLHGISSIKPWELRGVLDKLSKVYQKERARNLLFSVEDFANIFPDAMDLGQKVMTALMMIERDYLIKSRFNVIIARPKKLFTRVFARIESDTLPEFMREYGTTCTAISYRNTLNDSENAYAYIEIDLDQLWRLRFREISFPMLKSKFFSRSLFGTHALSVVPQLKFTFKVIASYGNAINQLQQFVDIVFDFFTDKKSFFKENDLAEHLKRSGMEERKAKSISQRLLSMYGSHRASPSTLYDPNAFLQRRHSSEPGVAEYIVFRNMHLAERQQIMRLAQKLFDVDREEYVRYAGRDSGSDTRLMRLGYLLEMADAGLFETVGGEAPMVFVRINDTRKVIYDARNPRYDNILLNDVHRRHKVSVDIFKHFFLRDMPDAMRWNFIEDYFLGKDMDELLELYPGEPAKANTDIITLLPASAAPRNSGNVSNGIVHVIEYPPEHGRKYNSNHQLSLDTAHGTVTRTISHWIKEDPVVLAIARDEHQLIFDPESYKVLESIVSQDEAYMRRKKGFEHKVRLAPDGELKPARSHFLQDPVKFYKWYCLNRDKVKLTFKERIEFYQAVNNKDKNALKESDKTHLQSGR